MGTPQLPAQNIVTDDGLYPFSALVGFIKRLILGAGNSTVVWRPGAASSGNVFGTWAEVVAAVSKMNGSITIGVDTTIAPAVVPAGAWNLRPAGVTGDVELVRATPGTGAPFVTIANAAVTINGLDGIRDVQIDNRSTLDVITPVLSNPPPEFYVEGQAAIFQSVLSGGKAFIKGPVTLFMRDFAFISSLDGGTNALQNQTGSIVQIEAGSTLDVNQFQSAGAIVTVSGPSVPFSDPPYQPQAGAPTVFPQGMVQKGTAAIVVGSGKSAAIPAFIRATSRILVSGKTLVTDANTKEYAALGADRVNGVPGSFKISALLSGGAGGAINGADASTEIDWEVINT